MNKQWNGKGYVRNYNVERHYDDLNNNQFIVRDRE